MKTCSKCSKTKEIVEFYHDRGKPRARRYGTPHINQKVEIDHIIPCCSAKTEAEFIALQHYTNLQYLTPEDHKKKTANMYREQM